MSLQMTDWIPLPFHDALYPDESFMGFVLRLSNKNGLSGIHWLYQRLGRDKLNRFKPEDSYAIAKLFGTDMKTLDFSMVRSRRIEGVSARDAHGHRISRPYLVRPLRPQLCPACVSVFGYARSSWDFSLVCACPWHNCMLIDACPSCGKKIQWMRPSFYACNCGFLWMNTLLEKLPVKNAGIRVARIIYNKLERTNDDAFRYSDPLDIALSALCLDTLMRVIWTFGVKSSPSDMISTGVSRIVLRTEAAGLYCKRGHARLWDLFAQSPDAYGLIKQTIHVPSLYFLAQEVSTDPDIKFIESILQKIDPNRSFKRRVGSTFNQLPLF